MRELFSDAFSAIKRNQSVVFTYILVLALLTLAIGLMDRAVVGELPEDATTPPWLPIYYSLIHIVFSAVVSVAQALLFARIGAEMDRPLWKTDGPLDNLRRYFTPWFILNLTVETLMQLRLRAYATEDPAAIIPMDLLFMFAFLFALPVGTCIMYHRRLVWSEIGPNLRPLKAFPQLTVAVLAIMLFQFMTQESALLLYVTNPTIHGSAGAVALLSMPLALLDCVAFAAMWQICMLHRNLGPDHDNDYDF